MVNSNALKVFQGIGRYGVLLALIALVVFGWLRYENFLGTFNVLSVLRYNSMFALVALGMCFVIITGGIDLSVGSTPALGSVVAAILSPRSEEHTSELQSRQNLVCRLLLEKKKKKHR